MQLTHVITGLSAGGAETALFDLVAATRGVGVRHSVVSMAAHFRPGGSDEFTSRFVALGIPVHSLGMTEGIPDPRALVRLVNILRRERPDVVHGWMWHANLLGGLAAAGLRIPVVWDIHHVDVEPPAVRRSSYWTNRTCARLSGVVPARVVCRAAASARSHERLGYRRDRIQVIPNGFDVDRFSFDAAAGRRVRRELAIPAAAPVVGLLARFHPDKDHATFLEAARRVAVARRDAFFLLAGDQVDRDNAPLVALVDRLELRDRVRLVGKRRDVPALLSAIDVLASSSRSEAFPLVLGEAMACGVPCAATDCGDSAEMVGDTGTIVPPRHPAALAAAISDLLALSPGERDALGSAARRRVCARYDLRVIAARYLRLYRELAPGAAPAHAEVARERASATGRRASPPDARRRTAAANLRCP